MIKRTLQTFFIAVSIISSCSAFADKPVTQNELTIVDLFLKTFKAKNENINIVDIMDTRWASSSKETGYIVIVRGYVKEHRSFSGNWDDELFGFFIVDRRLSHIIKTLDIVRTPRWHDYWYSVKGQARWSQVIIEGHGGGHGSSPVLKKYNLKNVPWPGFITPNKALKRDK